MPGGETDNKAYLGCPIILRECFPARAISSGVVSRFTARHTSAIWAFCVNVNGKGNQLKHGSKVYSKAYLGYPVVLGEVDSKGNQLRRGGEVCHMHEQVQQDGHGIGVDEHGFVTVVL